MLTKNQKIFFSLIWIFFFITIFSSFGNYKANGTFAPTFGYLIQFMASNAIYLLILIGIMGYFSFWQYRFYKKKIENRDNCQIQFIDLEKVAHAWMDEEEIELRALELSSKQLDFMDYSTVDKEIVKAMLGRDILNKNILLEYIIPYISFYTKEEIDIACDLIELLEKNEVSSVASWYIKDTDITNYKAAITPDGKTSYDILGTYKLLEHTEHVIWELFNLAKTVFQDNISTMASKLLIIALGHDIGKIYNAKQVADAIGADTKESLYKQRPHESISKMIMLSLYPDYKYIDIVCEAIGKHHIIIQEDKFGKGNASSMSDYATLLKKADTKAREFEIKLYLKNKKHEIDNKNNAKNDNKGDTNKEEEQQTQVSENEITVVISEEFSSEEVEKREREYALINNKQASSILAASKITPENTADNKATEPKKKDNTASHQKEKQPQTPTLFEGIDEVINEELLIDLLRKNVNITQTKVSGKVKVISCSSDDGKLIYYDEVSFKEILKQIKSEGDMERASSMKDRAINPIISQMMINNAVKQEVAVFQTKDGTVPSTKQKVYLINSDYIKMDENEIIKLKEDSELLAGVTVKIIEEKPNAQY